MRAGLSRAVWFGVAVVASTLGDVRGSQALENEPGYRPGVTEGLPVGADLPPGWYVSADTTYYAGKKQNGDGADNPLSVSISKGVTTLRGAWVPGGEFLGGVYSFAVLQPLATVSVNVAGGTSVIALPSPAESLRIPIPGSKTYGSGLGDTGVFPVNISWAVRGHWFITSSLGFYIPDGDYTPTSQNINAVNIGNGYWTFEPSVAVSYLTSEGHISANFVYDKAFQNDHISTIQLTGGGTMTGHYQSGDMFMIDASAVKFISKWSVGVSGYYAVQVTDDTLDEEVVPAMSISGLGNTRGEGNRYEKLGFGPVVGYDFGTVKLQAYYNHDFFAYNALKSESVWLRASLKLP